MNRYYSENALAFETVGVGDLLPTLVKHPSEVDVVRFCAAIRNFHRFHYDQAFTQDQGIPDLLVPGFLSGNWCIEAATRGFRPGVEVASLKFRNTHMAPVGTSYHIEGHVDAIDAASATIRCRFAVKCQNTDMCVTTASVVLRRATTQSNTAGGEL